MLKLFNSKRSLSQKIKWALLMIEFIVVAFVGWLLWQNHQFERETENFIQLNTHENGFYELENQIQNDFSELILHTVSSRKPSDFLNSQLGQEKKEKFLAHIYDYQKKMGRLNGFSDMKFNMEAIKVSLESAFADVAQNTENKDLARILPDISQKLSQTFSDFHESWQETVRSQNEFLKLKQKQNFKNTLWILFLCLILITVAFLKISKHIQNTIQQLAVFSENVSRGYLEHRLVEKGDTDLDVLISAFNHMTENLSKASEIIDERDQRKDEFVSVVSHEIRTPIAILQRVLENMKSGVAGNLTVEQENLLKIAENNILRLSNLVKNLLDMARLESGKIKMQPTKINMREILEDLEFGFLELAQKENKKLEIVCESQLPHCFADSELIIQVITNFYNNALRFAKSQIVIQVQSHKMLDKNGIKLSVRDDGLGIEPENQKKLFQKFVQINRQNSGSGYKGTGLGLVIAKQIIEQHGGTIGVFSNPPQGTEFYFILPIQATHLGV